MSERSRVPSVVVGACNFSSLPFSNEWRLERGGEDIARLHRRPTRHISTVTTTDGNRFELVPDGWGLVRAIAPNDRELGQIRRLTWSGRRWSVATPGFFCELTSDPRPRAWTMRLGGEPIGALAGTLFSYNTLSVHTDVSAPVTALTLMWHVLARPWEAAAAPGALVPSEARREAWRAHG